MIPVYVEVLDVPWDVDPEQYGNNNKIAVLKVGPCTVLEVPFYASHNLCEDYAADAMADKLAELFK